MTGHVHGGSSVPALQVLDVLRVSSAWIARRLRVSPEIVTRWRNEGAIPRHQHEWALTLLARASMEQFVASPPPPGEIMLRQRIATEHYLRELLRLQDARTLSLSPAARASAERVLAAL